MGLPDNADDRQAAEQYDI